MPRRTSKRSARISILLGRAATKVSWQFDRKIRPCCKALRANYYCEKLLESIAMAAILSLGNLEEVIDRLVASGRYGSKIEVIREGVRLVEERERRLAGTRRRH